MTRIFLYGTLLDPELLEIVLGRVPDATPASADGFGAAWVKDCAFPMIYAADGQADGVVIEADRADIARLDFYEGPYGYDLEPIDVVCNGQTVRALTYMPPAGKFEAGPPWTIDAWTQRHGALRKVAAAEIMDRFGRMTAAEVARRMPVILARAQQVINANSGPSVRNLRAKNDAQRVELLHKTRDHDNWFLTEEFDLTHPRFDGTQSRSIKRAVFVMADAVTVLPYDPATDSVLLIEQFRAGIWRRGDPHPWSLEIIAGRIDGGETAEQAAHREAHEETGLAIRELVRISGYYASPGAATEYLTSYIGLTDLSTHDVGVGGLASEDEDIRSMIVPFATLMEAVESGEAENAPLLVSALWLAAKRDRLRANG